MKDYFNLIEDEADDVIRRINLYKGKSYPMIVEINGKNTPVTHEIIEGKKRLIIKELQKGEVKVDKYNIWVVLKSPEGELKTEQTKNVLEYFENLPKSN